MCALTKNRFATFGEGEKKIKIWKGDVPYSETLIAETPENEEAYSSQFGLVQLKDKEILALAAYGVYQFDLNNYNCIKVIKESCPEIFFIQLNEDLFATNGFLIDIKKGEVKKFFREWYNDVENGLLLSNGRLLFVTTYTNIDHGGSSSAMRLLDIQTEKQACNSELNSYPFETILIDEHTFIAAKRYSIQIWNY